MLGAGLRDLHLHRDLLGAKMTLPACFDVQSAAGATDAGASEAVLEHSSWIFCYFRFLSSVLCRCLVRPRCTMR